MKKTLWLECGPYTFPNGGAHPCAIEDPRQLWEPRRELLIVLGDVARHRATPKGTGDEGLAEPA